MLKRIDPRNARFRVTFEHSERQASTNHEQFTPPQ
jgi:hypothetical protein